MDKIISIILAAGKGTRMKTNLPKVLIEVGGKTLVEHCVDTAKKLDVNKIIVVVGYRKEIVMSVLGGRAEYAFQESQLGTGHAVLQTRSLLKDFEGYVFVSNGDMPFITKHMFKNLYNACKIKKASAAMLTVETKDYPSWGRIIRDENGFVEKIVEAKDADDDQLKVKEKNAGIYCFKSKELFGALGEVKSVNAQKEYYLTDVIEIFKKQNKRVVSVITDSYDKIVGINTPEELEAARKIIKQK